jgi:hypothetical protein
MLLDAKIEPGRGDVDYPKRRRRNARHTAAVATARSWCSVMRVRLGSRYRPGPTFSRAPDLVIRVSVLV